jgi:uncharacterized protein YbbK (DUF523 family)
MRFASGGLPTPRSHAEIESAHQGPLYGVNFGMPM